MFIIPLLDGCGRHAARLNVSLALRILTVIDILQTGTGVATTAPMSSDSWRVCIGLHTHTYMGGV